MYPYQFFAGADCGSTPSVLTTFPYESSVPDSFLRDTFSNQQEPGNPRRQVSTA